MSEETLPEGIVRASVAPMLARRARHAEQVSQAVLGTRVRVRDEGRRWLRIVTPDGYEGWAPAATISRRPYPPATDQVAITELWANLRPRPDARAPSWITAFIGCRLNRAGESAELNGAADWVGVALPAGGTAWVEAHRVRSVGPRPAAGAEEVVATAERFLGVPYLWGGCTPLGLDCSGLVQLVYSLLGIDLPRDAYQQAACGDAAAFSRLAPGDLLCFGRNGSGAGGITHVGIARGDGSFLHAAGGRGVQVNGVKEEEFQARFRGARRILKRCV